MPSRRRSSFLMPNVHVPNAHETSDLSSLGKQLLHVVAILLFVYAFEERFGILKDENPDYGGEPDYDSQSSGLGALFYGTLYLSRLLTLLLLPQYFCNFCGLVLFNSFKPSVSFKYSVLDAPVISFRSISRGSHPGVVQEVVRKNIEVLELSGIQNYVLEVITDHPIGFQRAPHFVERVIPADYRTKNGAIGKARSLQYCLDEPNEPIFNNSWFVHIDEETILTEDAINGILNFCCSGKYLLGNGLVTSVSENLMSCNSHITDVFRIADDFGHIRFQFKALNKPLFGWKKSFMVTNAALEKRLGFDQGVELGSIPADQYFSLIAAREGYSFGFVEGEMHEEVPDSLMEQLKQRKLFLQGSAWISRARSLPWPTKGLLLLKLWTARLAPLMLPSMLFGVLWSVTTLALIDMVAAFVFAVRCYGFVFGVLRTFPNEQPLKTLCVLASPLVFVIDMVLESFVAIWAMTGNEFPHAGRKMSIINLEHNK